MTPTNQPPMELGPLDADILWLLNLTDEAGIWSHDSAHSSILIHGDHLYLNSGTGVDNTHKRIRTPDAPSLVVIDKRTGRLLARDREGMAPNIFHCTWSAPSMGVIDGAPRLFFAGGNGVIYGFEPMVGSDAPGEASAPSPEDAVPGNSSANESLSSPTPVSPEKGPATLKAVWQYDFDPAAPKEDVHRYNQNRREGPSNIYGMPVVQDGRLYVAGGGDLFWGKTEAWLQCIDTAGSGDVTGTALRWKYPLERHTISTVALHEGLVFVADVGRTVHCLDAETGQPHWTHEAKGDFWASPLVVDGKVYIGSRRGDFWVFEAKREKTMLTHLELGSPISATVTAANGVLYVTTMTHLYAVAAGRDLF